MGTVTIDGKVGESTALLTPLVVQNKLYLFFTGTGGHLDVAYYDAPSSSWKGMDRVSADLTNPKARYAAVYNTTKEQVEVYYVLDGPTTDINYRYLDLATGKWSSKVVIPGKTGLLKNLSGVFFQKEDGTYVTYLAFATEVSGKRAIWVYHLVDGAVVKSDTNAAWVPNCNHNAPYLADLGQDRMALLWGQKVKNAASWEHYYHIFDKDKQAWTVSVKAASETNSDWSPTGAIQYVRTKDSSSDGGYRWDARFCIFYGCYYMFDSRWFMREAFTEGYWKGAGTSVVDFIQSEKETFATWPLLAVLDLPPFLVNSSTKDPGFPCDHEDDCTRVELKLTSETATMMDGSLEAGVYFGKEAKKMSPLTFDFSAGASAALGGATTLTVERIDRLVRNTEGKVLALYLAPQMTTYKMEWYNLYGVATGQYAYPVRVTGYALSTRIFKPDEGPCEPCNGSNEECCEGVTKPYFDKFPLHKDAIDKYRLATYYSPPDPAYSVALSANGSWNDKGSTTVRMQVDKDHTTSYGGYFKFKIGASFARLKGIGGGVEGSFEIKYTTTTKSGVTAEISLMNPEARVKGTDVTCFDVIAYWLDSVENAFWIPVHRKGLGDSPWFLTYEVLNVKTYQGSSEQVGADGAEVGLDEVGELLGPGRSAGAGGVTTG